MAAQIELVSVMFECCSEAAYIRVTLEYGDANGVRAQFVSDSQSGGSSAENDDMFGVCYLRSPLLRTPTKKL